MGTSRQFGAGGGLNFGHLNIYIPGAHLNALLGNLPINPEQRAKISGKRVMGHAGDAPNLPKRNLASYLKFRFPASPSFMLTTTR